MDHEPVTAAQTALQQRVARVLAGTAEFKAPQTLEARVLSGIERRVKVPWWRRRVPEWPLLAQLLFGATGIATAAALLLARPATPQALSTVINQPAAVLQQPATDLHTTLNVLAVFQRLADTVAGALPDAVWYGGLGLCITAYLALFFLILMGYRLLRAPLSFR
jgi:hypothetical protein